MLKRAISNKSVTVLKARGKRTLAAVNCQLLQNDVSHDVRRCNVVFLRLEDVTNTCKRMRHESWKKLKTQMCFRID